MHIPIPEQEKYRAFYCSPSGPPKYKCCPHVCTNSPVEEKESLLKRNTRNSKYDYTGDFGTDE